MKFFGIRFLLFDSKFIFVNFEQSACFYLTNLLFSIIILINRIHSISNFLIFVQDEFDTPCAPTSRVATLSRIFKNSSNLDSSSSSSSSANRDLRHQAPERSSSVPALGPPRGFGNQEVSKVF